MNLCSFELLFSKNTDWAQFDKNVRYVPMYVCIDLMQ
jgi:hypothetical protein